MSREPHRTYALTVVVEPAEGAWHAYCPALRDYGAATWGATRADALGHIGEMVAMLVERLAEKGAPIPTVADPAPVPPPTEQVIVTVGGGTGPASA
jgi:predicted RNase H-like HicB family nuclease